MQSQASVIIPSYNGARKISHLLDSLCGQSFSGFEVIVVIDGSTDNTADVLSSYRDKFSNLRIITQSNKGRSVTRNNGAAEAKGDVLIFYDDDMIPERESVAKHLNFHRSYDGIVCGDIVEESGAHKTDIQNYKAWLTVQWMRKYETDVNRMKAEHLFFSAANCSLPRKIFNSLNGFDEGLADAEDYDLASRALKSGIAIYYDRRNKALHNEDITCRSYIRRLREYSEAHKKLRGQHPEDGTGSRWPLRTIIYRAFSFPFLVRLIDNGFFVFLPRIFRFRLYSIIIQALANENSKVQL